MYLVILALFIVLGFLSYLIIISRRLILCMAFIDFILVVELVKAGIY